MRKLVLSMVVSVDGYIEGIGGEFVAPEWSSDLDGWTAEMIDRFDTLLYGRVAWHQMADYWPAAEASGTLPAPQAALARFMNGSKKIVFSRGVVDTSRWSNSIQATEDVATTLAKERQAEGRDLVVFAGARFAQSALRTGLVDELWLLTMPRLFGGGTRLFDNHGTSSALKRLDVRPLDTGAIFTRYAVVS